MDHEHDPWRRVDVTSWEFDQVEPQGSEGAIWLRQNEHTGSMRWLHKSTVIPRNRVEQGEDWSEVISTQVALLLGVPCAETRLCLREGRRGSISRSVVPDGWSLNEGRVWLEAAGGVKGYVPHRSEAADPEQRAQELRRAGHNLANIRIALKGVAAPLGYPELTELSGFDVFVGYLLLDALIANSDRHEQNWAVMSPQVGKDPDRLSPSYDHATSLGFNLHDAKRKGTLTQAGGLARYAARGLARRFEHRLRPTRTLVDLAEEGVSLCSAAGRSFWRERLHGMDLEALLSPLRHRAIPEMSEAATSFASELLQLNLRRLRDVEFRRS